MRRFQPEYREYLMDGRESRQLRLEFGAIIGDARQ